MHNEKTLFKQRTKLSREKIHSDNYSIK